MSSVNIPGVFNPNRCKVLLKVAINRLKLIQQKKNSINQATRKEIALLLEKGKEESARVRVENIIREDYYIEALELLELYTETLIARFGLVETLRNCDPALLESIHTLIYASPRVEIKELHQVRDQLIIKYGREFAMSAMENADGQVNPRMIQKLKVSTPDPMLVNQYLKTIAAAFNVDWEMPPTGPADAITAIGGTGISLGGMTGMEGQASSAPVSSNTGYAQQYPQQYPNTTQLPSQPAQVSATLGSFSALGLPSMPQQHAPSAPNLLSESQAPSSSIPFGYEPSGGQGQAPGVIQTKTSPVSEKISSGVTAGPPMVAPGGDPDFDELAKRFEALKKKK